ncbi:hypothetical protein E2C01_020977 [Portunus trituberculatus]|uniref:Uncharacterized protein n=1 Tax=Portunus trituberculatus TaxID=210409 RepID=A0A5B7E1B5_PORTR|nr:hypothetical protein [Portunus trituberculatus]
MELNLAFCSTACEVARDQDTTNATVTRSRILTLVITLTDRQHISKHIMHKATHTETTNSIHTDKTLPTAGSDGVVRGGLSHKQACSLTLSQHSHSHSYTKFGSQNCNSRTPAFPMRQTSGEGGPVPLCGVCERYFNGVRVGELIYVVKFISNPMFFFLTNADLIISPFMNGIIYSGQDDTFLYLDLGRHQWVKSVLFKLALDLPSEYCVTMVFIEC